jgi:hypothetical protein
MSHRDELHVIRDRYIARLARANQIVADVAAGTVEGADGEKQIRALAQEQGEEPYADLLQAVYRGAAERSLQGVAMAIQGETLRSQALLQRQVSTRLMDELWQNAIQDYDAALQKLEQSKPASS